MQQTCSHCATLFEITDEDLDFYEKVSPIFAGKKYAIAPPKQCPICRRQRKLAWRNEKILYRRNCDLCGASMVSTHAPQHPYPVYCNPCWWSPAFDPLSYGQEFDPNTSFFEQFSKLYEKVPQRAMMNENGVTSENCEYTFDVPFAKNCYMCSGMWKVQDCYYCRYCDQSKFCVDCEGVTLGSELVYESCDSQKLYGCRYMQNSESCNDCIFGFDLKGCSDCLGCIAQRQQRYRILNEQYSKEEYEEKVKQYHLDTHKGVENFRQTFEAFKSTFPRKCTNMRNCEDCAGDQLFSCRNVIGYSCTNSENSKWVERSDAPIWSYDQVQSGNPQWSLECITIDNGYGNICTMYSNQSRFVLYSENCFASDSVFGCVSLRKNKYCILNKQYSKEEYEELAGNVATRMMADGEFGEFFPIELSPYAYNETNAQEFYPLSREEVCAKGWKWSEQLPFTTGKETLLWNSVPERIADVDDTLSDAILACTHCKQNYKIVPQELTFYKNMGIPIPQKCPSCRNKERLGRRNPQQLWKRECAKCRKEIQTTYAPNRPEIVYCESCYLSEVY